MMDFSENENIFISKNKNVFIGENENELNVNEILLKKMWIFLKKCKFPNRKQ